MRFLLTAFMALALSVSFSKDVRADYFVWQDSASGLTFTYPDTWRVVSNAKPDDLVTVMAPSGRGLAQCRVRSSEDGRYGIFPPRYDWAIQKIDFSFDFWENYLTEYANHEIYNVRNGAGLGRGYAGYAIASYDASVPGPMMRRKALMFASLYHDRLFVVDCSAHVDAFDRWKGLFLSIAGSVDFKKQHYEMNTGNYRNFLHDAPVVLHGERGQVVYSY